MRLPLLAVLASLATACGPGFQGSWSGSFTSAVQGGIQTGTLTLLVSGDNVLGNGHNDQASQDFTIDGSIRGAGDAIINYTFSQSRATYNATGKVAVDSAKLTGTLDLAVGGALLGTTTISLTSAR